MACLLLRFNIELSSVFSSIFFMCYLEYTMIGLGPFSLEVYFFNISIVFGKNISMIFIKLFATLNIWSWDLKLTVNCLIWGYSLSINYFVSFLNIDLISENLNITPLEIDWAVSPAYNILLDAIWEIKYISAGVKSWTSSINKLFILGPV